jgi:hypothetical protein
MLNNIPTIIEYITNDIGASSPSIKGSSRVDEKERVLFQSTANLKILRKPHYSL